MKFHPLTWMIWTLSAFLVGLLSRNPVYLIILSGIIYSLSRRFAKSQQFPSPIRLYIVITLVTTAMNFVFSRAGNTILFQIPIRGIAGPYTLEALAFGAAAGIQIATMLLIMIFFSQVVTPQDILRRTPSGFYALGVTASIGFSFAPRINRALSELQEAYQIRGYSSRGWRDFPKLMTPLVIISLENSLSIAEGLVSRGWPRVEYSRRFVLPGWIAIAIGIGSVTIGGLRPFFVGMALFFGCGALWFGYRGKNKISRYRPEVWSFPDCLVIGGALGVLVVFLLLAGFAPAFLAFYPFPNFIWPTIAWPIAAAIGLLATPLVVLRD